jgi:hypothetical protein
MGHKNIQHTVRYTELAPDRFKEFWRDLLPALSDLAYCLRRVALEAPHPPDRLLLEAPAPGLFFCGHAGDFWKFPRPELARRGAPTLRHVLET